MRRRREDDNIGREETTEWYPTLLVDLMAQIEESHQLISEPFYSFINKPLNSKLERHYFLNVLPPTVRPDPLQWKIVNLHLLVSSQCLKPTDLQLQPSLFSVWEWTVHLKPADAWLYKLGFVLYVKIDICRYRWIYAAHIKMLLYK